MAATWRLIISSALDGATNMALDHALARLAGQGAAPPTLRFYRWQPACVSLGYFQSWHDVQHTRCAEHGFDVVRRPTGGKAIVHATELTYAITAPLATPGFSRSILETYAFISKALLQGLYTLNVPAQWSPPATTPAGSAACFDTPAAYEITVHGRKLVGSAQTRTSGAVLQHGTLLLAVQPALLEQVLRLPATHTSVTLAEKMIALDEVLGRPVNFAEVATALVKGISTTWQIDFKHGNLTTAEWQLAEQLKHERYANPHWVQRR